ncbi:prolyl-tRNA editing enzyme YbaK/EbsC (Cys-tRNA(Pro) deacylase) [Sedimentibacter acidaminivorans]|uniref:Prolyl-tRNA editing enzyme YbaK/EbsC (Cys-tRNA(Pro) deacylase) n=1 Tax=Sedimentibacter acidaminivorans TaxID=913099 RepID=A0ABS4GHZ6_9FIRM|nr:YbaK/EbsC family protein [Sedimentibacter acidaminivorans]MBP1926985.1 prolyl-tRNA editing enzyme YbaK/EbsC (Cys-tRNA(Pro) deacylase) [Sedimentibacter acidaminivorans]
MSIEKVREYLKQYNREEDILEMESSTATVELAAQALGTAPARIAKSLSFQYGESAMIIVVAGDAKIDNKKFKNEFGFKAKMLSPEDAIKFTGHAVGGVCPFALPNDVKVFLDESMKRFETMFPACGSSNSAIELTLGELEEYSISLKWINVCKGWE